MKKRMVIIVAVCCIALSGCSGAETDSDKPISTQEEVEETEEVEKAGTSAVLPDDFEVLSNSRLEELPDRDSLESEIGTALKSIGVQTVESKTYGNYKAVSSVYIDLYACVKTDLRTLMVSNQYLNDKWKVIYIKDAENGNVYYPTTGENAYDYVSGECINPIEENDDTESIEITESEVEVPHRDGMYGISDKDVYDIGSPSTFQRDDVRNDITGDWKISTISEELQMVDYALSYYEKYFYNDDEVHGIVNFNDHTTTSITYMSGQIYVTVHDYVDGEEHDANLLFSGTVLSDYIVYPDNGDIEQIQ